MSFQEITRRVRPEGRRGKRSVSFARGGNGGQKGRELANSRRARKKKRQKKTAGGGTRGKRGKSRAHEGSRLATAAGRKETSMRQGEGVGGQAFWGKPQRHPEDSGKGWASAEKREEKKKNAQIRISKHPHQNLQRRVAPKAESRGPAQEWPANTESPNTGKKCSSRRDKNKKRRSIKDGEWAGMIGFTNLPFMAGRVTRGKGAAANKAEGPQKSRSKKGPPRDGIRMV